MTGTGGAIGLRAIGWQVVFTGPPGRGPTILCPSHRFDTIACLESPGRSFLCAVCRADLEAALLQEPLYTAADRATLQQLNGG